MLLLWSFFSPLSVTIPLSMIYSSNECRSAVRPEKHSSRTSPGVLLAREHPLPLPTEPTTLLLRPPPPPPKPTQAPNPTLTNPCALHFRKRKVIQMLINCYLQQATSSTFATCAGMRRNGPWSWEVLSKQSSAQGAITARSAPRGTGESPARLPSMESY